MRKTAVVLAVAAAVAAAAVLVNRFDRERQYRQLLAVGARALGAGDSYPAIEAFSGALALRPDSMVAYYRRGEAYRSKRHYAEAISDWKQAHRLAPNAPRPLVALGELYDTLDRPALAAEQYAAAARLLKDEDPSVLYSLALARYRSGSPAEAVDPLLRAVSRNDAVASAHYLLGLVYRDIQEPVKAIASLERAILAAPTLAPAREELADLYRSLGRHGDEIGQLQALSRLDPQVDRLIATALAQSRQQQFALALASLDDLAGRAPHDSRVDLARGRVQLARAEATGDKAAASRARDALEMALGGTARRSEGLALLGRALYLSGEFAQAERILREAAVTSPADRQAFAYLADAAERLSHPLVARDALLNLDALEGNTTAPADRLTRARRIGRLSLHAGDADTAVRYLQRVVDAGDADGTTLAWLAQAQWDTGAEDAARATLARALTDAPGNPDVVRIARVIR